MLPGVKNIKKKHWMEIAEEEHQYYRMLESLQHQDITTNNPPSCGGLPPTISTSAPLRLTYTPSNSLVYYNSVGNVSLETFQTVEPTSVTDLFFQDITNPITSISNLGLYTNIVNMSFETQSLTTIEAFNSPLEGIYILSCPNLQTMDFATSMGNVLNLTITNNPNLTSITIPTNAFGEAFPIFSTLDFTGTPLNEETVNNLCIALVNSNGTNGVLVMEQAAPATGAGLVAQNVLSNERGWAISPPL